MPYVPNTSDVLNMSEDLVRVAYAEEFTKDWCRNPGCGTDAE